MKKINVNNEKSKKSFLNLKNIIIMLCVLLFVLGYICFKQYQMLNTSFLSSITILDQKVNLMPGIYVYDVTIDKPKIDSISGGCELPYVYEVADLYKGSYENAGGLQYFVNGSRNGYFELRFYKKGSNNEMAVYYFNLIYNNPLEIAAGC